MFLILGIILLFVAGIGFYFVGSLKEQKAKTSAEKVQQVNLDVQPIETFLKECIKKVSIESAYEFGQQQGYHDTPALSLYTNYSNIAYYYHKGKSLVPKTEFLERELAKIIDENMLIECTDFSLFENLGYKVEFNDLNTTTKILKDEVIVNIDYPLSVKRGDTVVSLKKFSYKLPFRIGHMLDISKELLDAVVDEPYALDLTLLLNYDVGISVVHYDNCNDVYIIVDNESKTKPSDDDYVFTFAVSIDDKYCKINSSLEKTELKISYPVIENHEPILEPIPYLITDAGKEFSYKLSAFDEDNDTLFYLTDGILQNYTNVLTGLVKFTPTENQTGIHLINATVVDIKSGTDNKEFFIEIK